jgi:Na+-transporting methylmalonyl-CoA/oxaloacetate decarboxylase gamma subunit
MKILTKEKSKQKRKDVNNQNNSSFHYELFPVINIKLHHHYKSKKIN